MTLETDSKRRKRYRYRRNWKVSKEEKAPQKYQTFGFSTVEKMFYYYPLIKASVEDVKAEFGFYSSGHKEGGGSSNHAFISDPTFQIAYKRTQKIPKVVINSDSKSEDVVVDPEDWITVVDETLKRYPKHSVVGQVIRKRYLSNEPMATTCINHELTYSTYYRARDTGINYARECAIQLGLIKVF